MRADAEGSPSDGAPPAPANDIDIEIPADLVGARTKAQIETIAVLLNATPVNVLRAALGSGIWGDEPVFTPAEIATLRRLVTEFPAIAAELGIEDEAPISGEIGPTPGSGGPAAS